VVRRRVRLPWWVEAQRRRACRGRARPRRPRRLPLLQKDAWDLIRALVADGRRVLVETSGNIPFGKANELPAGDRERLCISMDVKCPGSGMADRNDLSLLADLRSPDQLKFVIAHEEDFRFAASIVRDHGPFPCPVFFNPVGGLDPKGITEMLLQQKPPLEVHVGIQLHKLMWGDVAGR
jgi:7-carboxy-7-deazaguanine synthase